MNCPNRPDDCWEWICFCGHPLNGSYINSWLGEGHRCYKLKSWEDRKEAIRFLKEEANHAYGMWRQTC